MDVSSFKSAERYISLFVGPWIRMGQMIITLALTFSVSAIASLNHKEQPQACNEMGQSLLIFHNFTKRLVSDHGKYHISLIWNVVC